MIDTQAFAETGLTQPFGVVVVSEDGIERYVRAGAHRLGGDIMAYAAAGKPDDADQGVPGFKRSRRLPDDIQVDPADDRYIEPVHSRSVQSPKEKKRYRFCTAS